ncbi:MAG: RDD family protein [Ramlibacter sp.]
MDNQDVEYVGFWTRVCAALIDSLLFLLVLGSVLYMLDGSFHSSSPLVDVLVNYVLPCAIDVFLWVRYGGTPGKYAMSARIVDADTGEPLSTGRALLRYLGYFVSAVPLGVGLLWVAFDPRKQGWHDKMANSVVVRPLGAGPVRFRQRFQPTAPTRRD